jgi:hypothetical protein
VATPGQLSLYNGALLMLGEGILDSLTEDRGPRHVLDSVWDRNAINYCLRQGLWNFAVRTVKADYDQSIEPSFGFPYAFAKSSDWLKTAVVAADDRFINKLRGSQYRDEAGYWFSDLQTLYIRFVSNDSDYGTAYSKWPADFERFVESYLAKMAGPRIKGVAPERIRIAEGIYDKLEAQAKSADASDDGPADPPMGTWARARFGGKRSRRDLGSQTQLIG